jgi:spore coat protein CotH
MPESGSEVTTVSERDTMSNYTSAIAVYYEGVPNLDLVVQWTYNAGCPTTHNDPGADAEVEIVTAKHNGEEVVINKEMEKQIMRALWHQAREDWMDRLAFVEAA